MENATKALLIAAAVLVVMLIIGLGIGVFNMASEQVDNAGDLSEYEIKQFNDKFTKYEGTNVSAAEVNTMLRIVFNHNLSEKDQKRRVRVGLNGGGNNNGSNISDSKKWLIMREQFNERLELPKVSSGSRYTVEAKYDSLTKLIYEIQVYEK